MFRSKMANPNIIFFVVFAAASVNSQTTLRALATSRGIHMGAAVKSGTRTAQYDTVLAREYNTVVAENDMKFGNIEPTQNNFIWTAADNLANFTQAHAMSMRGHNFVWHQQGGYAATYNGTRAQMLAILKNHILTVGGRYAGRIYEWDVVNEAIDDATNGLRTSFWQQRIGNDYIDSAFKWARQADPNAWLVYNDYSAEGSGAKSNAVYNLVSGLQSRGIPINGVGLQCHFSLNGFDTAALSTNMKRIAALGLNISITELDIRIPTPATTAQLDAQKQNYKAMLAVCLSNPNCKTFMTWGFTDASSWVPGFYPGYGAALPFDANYQPKPAYTGMIEALTAATPLSPVQGRNRLLERSRPFDLLGRAKVSWRKISIPIP